ncbi:uncharacterized protein [Aquarana catesbeiana]|uniref:uncharacterized protein isoform X2 n=1 Tax=Aquarana catesbeiana TaxID=8400 RepID=UPI003CC9C7EC
MKTPPTSFNQTLIEVARLLYTADKKRFIAGPSYLHYLALHMVSVTCIADPISQTPRLALHLVSISCISVPIYQTPPTSMENKWQEVYNYLALGAYPSGFSKNNQRALRKYASNFSINVKVLWQREDENSQEVVGPYPLYVYSFKTLRATQWLGDEVIDAYLHHLIKNQQESVRQISAVVADALFDGKIEKLGKKIHPENIWVCPVNVGQHWILVFAKEYLQSRTISNVKTSPEAILDA